MHDNFVKGPMTDKSVTNLAGIGPVLGERLKNKGYEKAYMVFGQFLVLGKDEKRFKGWLHETCKADKREQSDCYSCIQEWCDRYFN